MCWFNEEMIEGKYVMKLHQFSIYIDLECDKVRCSLMYSIRKMCYFKELSLKTSRIKRGGDRMNTFTRCSKRFFIVLLTFFMVFLFVVVGKINSDTFEYALCDNVNISACARSCIVHSSTCSGPSCANGGGCTTQPFADAYRIKAGYGTTVSACVSVGYAATCEGTYTVVDEHGVDYGLCVGPQCPPPASYECLTVSVPASCDSLNWTSRNCGGYICS